MPTIWIIGDSTVEDNQPPFRGWGWALPKYVKEGVEVKNHALSGRSTRSFREEGLWTPVEQGLSAGDLLLIQFGHNDEKDDPVRHTEPFGSFQENLRFFIREARGRGAFPVLITPIARRLFDSEGHFLPGSHGEYPEAIRQVGREVQVPVADLTALTEKFLADLGDEASKPLFVWPKDNTHLKYDGAVKMAELLCAQLREFGSPYADVLYRPEEGEL